MATKEQLMKDALKKHQQMITKSKSLRSDRPASRSALSDNWSGAKTGVKTGALGAVRAAVNRVPLVAAAAGAAWGANELRKNVPEIIRGTKDLVKLKRGISKTNETKNEMLKKLVKKQSDAEYAKQGYQRGSGKDFVPGKMPDFTRGENVSYKKIEEGIRKKYKSLK
jgi:hypothetical protein